MTKNRSPRFVAPARALLKTILLSVLMIQLVHAASVEDEYRVRMQHFCKWMAANAPDADAPKIDFCGPDGRYDFNTTYDQQKGWWNYWQDNHPDRWNVLKDKWDAELQSFFVEQERGEKLAREVAAKKARNKRIASIPSMSLVELCNMVRSRDWQPAHDELVKRKAFPPSELAQIAGRRAVLGMSEGAMLCALGSPQRSHRSVGSWGVDIQYVYPNELIVYTRNGKVTSWQD